MFEQIVQTLAELDFYQLFFPWLLVLAVSFGLLERYQFFGENSSVNGTIALSVAFLVTGGAEFFLPGDIFVIFAGALAFSVFGLLGLMILLGAIGVDIQEDLGDTNLPAVTAIVLAFSSFFTAIFYQREYTEAIVESLVNLEIPPSILGPAAAAIALLALIGYSVRE